MFSILLLSSFYIWVLAVLPLSLNCVLAYFLWLFFLRFSLLLVFKNWVVMWLFVVFFMFVLLESLRLLGSVSYSSIRLEKFQPLFLQMFFWPHFIFSFWNSNYKYVTLLDFVLRLLKLCLFIFFLSMFQLDNLYFCISGSLVFSS